MSHDTTRTIDQLRVAQKVITDAPTEALEAAERDLPMVGPTRQEPLDPATWKLIRLRAMVRWDDGTWDDINVETLQPPSWLAAHNVRVGGLAPIPLDLEELGLPEVLGKVLAIEPCPPVPPGPGRVILTTVNHLNADVHELTIRDASGRQETIRTTGGHKFYSATRTAWLSATDLEPGEQLHGLEGPVHVVSRARLPGVHRVYNLTVEGDHVYHVSPLGVLTHNTWSCFGAPRGSEIALGKDIPGGGYKQVAEQTGASRWENWAKDGLTRRTVSNHFGRAYHQAAQRASKIHFSLDGIDDVVAAVKSGKSGFTRGNMTNAELEYIFSNPEILTKTVFYRNGKIVPTPVFGGP